MNEGNIDHEGLEIHVMRDSRAFSALRTAWEELLQNSDANCLFLTWEWLHTWHKHLAKGRKPYIVTVWKDVTLVALAPLVSIPRRPARLQFFRVLEFLGTGTVGSDYLDIIVRTGWEEQVSKALVHHFRRHGFMLRLEKLRASGTASGRLSEIFKSKNWIGLEAKTGICPFIDLKNHSWESYLATLGSDHRYNINRRLRNLYKQFDVSFDLVTTESARKQALQQLFHLHRGRRDQLGGTNAFETDALEAFHKELTCLALTQGWLRLFVLSINGVAAAALYGFFYANKFYFYQSGLDMSYAKQSIGLVTTALAIQKAIEEGAYEYDLLEGSESYKFHWTSDTRDLSQMTFYSPNVPGFISRRLDSFSDGARKLARRKLPKPLADRLAALTRP